MRFFRRRVLLWPLVLFSLVAALVGGGALVGAMTGGLVGSTSQTRDSEVVASVQRLEQVALLGLNVQGIISRQTNGQLFDLVIPGSERAVYVQYSFQAKLGIDGSAVQIVPTGDHAYRLSIPAFTFIGYSEPHFETAVEDDGLLSFITPDIDTTDLVNDVLSDDNQAQYLADNAADLQAQATTFYTGIVTSVDPQATLTFDFAG